MRAERDIHHIQGETGQAWYSNGKVEGEGKWGGEREIHITHTVIQSHSAISWREGSACKISLCV